MKLVYFMCSGDAFYGAVLPALLSSGSDIISLIDLPEEVSE